MHSSYVPSEAAELFSDLDVPWMVAGGWAIDCFLGEQTRPHLDLDLAVLRPHQQAIRDYLNGWDLHVVFAPGVLEPWDGSVLGRSHHAVWCRPSPSDGWAFELLFNDIDGEEWLFRRNNQVCMPLGGIAAHTPDGMPYLIPEIVLLYKAKQCRPSDEADLHRCLPLLGRHRRLWLQTAIEAAHGSDHPWIEIVS